MGVLAIAIVCGVMWLSRCLPSFAEETNGLPENLGPLAQVFTEAVVPRKKSEPLPRSADEKADGTDPSPGSGIAPTPKDNFKEVFPSKNELFQNRIPIMGPMTSGGHARAIDPPTVDQILEVIRFSPPGSLPRVDRKKVVVERIADYADPPKKYPLIGLAQLHHAHYKCIVTLREDGTDMKKDEQDQLILFVDHMHLHVCEELAVSQESPAEDEPRARQRQPNEQTFPKVYNVGDLVIPLAPPVFSVTGEPIPAAKAEPDLGTLEELIQSTIAPHSWDRVGGPGALERFETNLSLVVSHTQAIHDEIADLLAQLRRLQELRVVLHATTLEVPVDFMKKRGLFGKRHAILTEQEQKQLLGAASRGAYARTIREMKAPLFNGQVMNLELDDDSVLSIQWIVKAGENLQLTAVLTSLESYEVFDSPAFTREQALLVRMSSEPKAVERAEFRLITAEVSRAKPVPR
jgi:hypothetical protein